MKTISRSKSRNHGIDADTLRHDLEALRADVAELATDTRRFARQKVGGLAESVRETASEAVERGRHLVEDEYDRAIGYARQNPVITLSVGLLTGLVIGSVLRGRDR